MEKNQKIKEDLDLIEKNLKNSFEKKDHLTNCLKVFFLNILKSEELFQLLGFDLNEILINLWKIKFVVDKNDLPNFLDNFSKNYLIEYAKTNWLFQKIKTKNQSRMSVFIEKVKKNNNQTKILEKNSINDYNGLLTINELKRNFKKFENNLDKTCEKFLKVFFIFIFQKKI